MKPLNKVIINKDTSFNPIWIMRQAGRYLPEFRKIRKKNTNFVKLCLNVKNVKNITLQPLKRYDLDAAIIFSDILMVPLGLGQSVEFKKNFGPFLGPLSIDGIKNYDNRLFKKKLEPVYKSIRNVKRDKLLKNKDLIGFVGAPWTLLVYMINRVSPKNGLSENFFSDKNLISDLLKILDRFIKVHIRNQVKAGATLIQIFDSWAGLITKDFDKYLYNPTASLVNYTKEIGVPVICFPRGISNYAEYCKIVNPDMINIDYNINPKELIKNIQIPVQGGLDPKVLLTDKDNLRKQVTNYLEIFKSHPYVFNLGHGILPETKIDLVNVLINTVRNFK